MDPKWGLLYLPAIAGAALLVFGCWLVLNAKPVKGEGEALHVKVPIFGEYKTNSPAIAIFIISFLLMFLPIYYSSTANQEPAARHVIIAGEVDSPQYPVNVYAVSGSDEK